MTNVHESPYAGSWYPGRPAELEQLIDRLFEASLRRTGPCLYPEPLAFVVPHAGLAYSGTVAAAAYRCLRAVRPERVFLLGFSHRGGRRAAEIPAAGAISTPLGEVKLDTATMRTLIGSRPFKLAEEDQVCDHSIEIQLPMLQFACPGARVVPVYTGHLTESDRCAAAEVLAGQFQPGDVLLASSDLTHYGHAFHYEPFPPGEDAGTRLWELDEQAISAAGSLDSTFFLGTLAEIEATVCGSEPIALLIETLNAIAGEDVFQLKLDYQTSGEMTGDYTHSVSYGSMGYFREHSFYLGAEDREVLLASAVATLRNLRETGRRHPVPPSGDSQALKRKSAAFVSIHDKGELYGCIGSKEGDLPLADLIPHLTLSAALDDPRFFPRAAVPEGLDIEISILTPMKRISDWRRFKLGRDGALIEHKGRRGLLLPQVAGGQIDSEQKFLEILCRKAGLDRNAYGDPKCRLSVFRAQVFGAQANGRSL